MDSYLGIERRDPAAGVLRLGRALGSAYEEARTGVIVVSDEARAAEISVRRGRVTCVDVGCGAAPPARWTKGPSPVAVERLFAWERPRVFWREERAPAPGAAVDPRLLIVAGVLGRGDVFLPQHLVERIPIDVLRMKDEDLRTLSGFAFRPEERAFLTCLLRPTPVAMLLWKRGLQPSRAGAMLVALNLSGMFRGQWEPGFLPRMSTALRVMGMVRRGCADRVLLGVVDAAGQAEVDRAFRRLSRELHPDRAERLPRHEAELARRAFLAVNDAYARVRKSVSRRRRPVAAGSGEACAPGRGDDWEMLAGRARLALEAGELGRARAYALKALLRMPPRQARRDLLRIISQAA